MKKQKFKRKIAKQKKIVAHIRGWERWEWFNRGKAAQCRLGKRRAEKELRKS